MPSWILRLRAAGGATGLALVTQARTDRRYAAYPRYAVLVALAVWLLEQLPAGTDAMAVRASSPGLMLLWCAVCVGGAGLAAALSLVGVWRPGRGSIALCAAALVICCLPVG